MIISRASIIRWYVISQMCSIMVYIITTVQKKKSISMQGKIALAAHEQNCWFHQTQAADTKRDLILRCRLSISNRFVMSIGYFFRQSSRQKLFSDMYCCELWSVELLGLISLDTLWTPPLLAKISLNGRWGGKWPAYRERFYRFIKKTVFPESCNLFSRTAATLNNTWCDHKFHQQYSTHWSTHEVINTNVCFTIGQNPSITRDSVSA